MRLNIRRPALGKFKSIVMYTVSFLMILGAVGFAAPRFFGQVAHAAGPWTVNNTLYPDNSGCTSSTFQCATIQAAVNAADSGDTINVGAGIYNESPNITKSVILQSTEGRNVTTVKSLIIATSSVTVSGFTIEGVNASGAVSANVFLRSGVSNVTVSNNKIINVGSGDDNVNGDTGVGLLTTSDLVNIGDNLNVTDNIFQALNTGSNRAFFINPGINHFIFSGNTITGNFAFTATTSAQNGLVENNTITGAGAVGLRSAGFRAWGYPNPTVWGRTTFSGNTVSGVKRGITVDEANNVTITRNTLSGNEIGVRVVANTPLSFDITTISVHNNNLSGEDIDGYGVTNNEIAIATSLDATNNWWGSASGPGAVGHGTGDNVSTNVNYKPWCTDSGCTTFSSTANVSNLGDLKTALANTDITTINITADIPGIPATLVVPVGHIVTINGGGKTLTFTGLESFDKVDDGFMIQAPTTINDLIVDAGLVTPKTWVGTYAIQVFNTTAILNNVTAKNGNGGILGNNSTVTLTGTMNVSGNGFGGIESSGVSASLNVSGSSLTNTSEAYGLPTVWEDGLTRDTVTGGSFTQITKGEQYQYYLIAGNSLPDTTAPNVNFVNPTPGDESYTKGVITGHVIATDAVGMGSYYIRVWKNAFESGTGNLVKECSSAPGGNLLSTSQDVTCGLDTTTLTPGKYVFSAQFLDSSSNWGTAFRTFYVDNTAPTATIDGITPQSLYNGSANINVHAIDDNYLKTDLYIEGEASSFKTYTDVYFGLSWLGDGNYRMVVIDKAGNSTEYKFTIDKTAPVIALQGANPQTIERGISYNELGATVSDTIDSGLVATIDASNVNTSVVGTYTVKYDAVDTAGNHATQVARTVNVVDTVSPLLTSVSIISNNTHPKFARQTNKVTISFIADESLASKPTVTIAGVAATVTGSGTTWSAVHTMSATDAEGYIPFTINFSDLSSNPGLGVTTTTNGSTVLYDRTKPTVSITTTGTSPTKNSPIHATFTFSEPVMNFAIGDIAVTNATKASFVKVDPTTIDGRTYTTTYTANITPIADGAVTINILTGKANDVGNNGNIAATPYTIVYDSIAPTINLAGDNPQTIEAGIAYVELDATWEDSIDGSGDVSDITGTVDTMVPGDYTITYSKTDAADNTGTATRTVTVKDTTKPDVKLDSIASPTGGSTDSIDITGTVSDIVGVTSYELSIDGSVVATGTNTVAPYDWDISSLPSGTYTVTLTATDAAGNTNSATQDVVIDNTAPILVVNSSTGTDTTPTVTGTTDGATDAVTVDGVTATVSSIANGNGTYGWTYTMPTQSIGIHTIIVKSTDSNGNPTSEIATVTVNQAPATQTVQQPTTTPLTTTLTTTPQAADATTNAGGGAVADTTGQVLGDQTSKANTNDKGTVKGDSTTKNNDNIWSFLGLAWYWWLLILAAVASAWWAFSAIRNRRDI